MSKQSRMLVNQYVSENVKNSAQAQKARATNVANWFLNEWNQNKGQFVTCRQIRNGIPSQFKKPGYNPNGDARAASRAIEKYLGLSYEDKSGKRHYDVSLPNLKRCVSFLLGARNGTLKMVQPVQAVKPAPAPKPAPPKPVKIKSKLSVQAKTDLVLIDILERVCFKDKAVFNRLDSWEKGFVGNISQNYPNQIKSGRRNSLSPAQRESANKLIRAHAKP